MKYILITILTILILGSCANAPDFPITPNIEFLSFSKTSLTQGSVNNDSTFLTISFEDGDGDIGLEAQSAEQNLFIIDNRTGEIFDRFKTPNIPEEGVGNGVSGEIRVLLFTTCCTFPDNIPPCESPDQYPTNELTFDVYLIDRAGHQSNTITTGTLTLNCD